MSASSIVINAYYGPALFKISKSGSTFTLTIDDWVDLTESVAYLVVYCGYTGANTWGDLSPLTVTPVGSSSLKTVTSYEYFGGTGHITQRNVTLICRSHKYRIVCGTDDRHWFTATVFYTGASIALLNLLQSY